MTVLWSVTLGVFSVAAVGYCVWQSVTSARTPQGAVAWVIFLLVAPWFALPAYLVFGHHKLRTYTRARRESRKLTSGLIPQGNAGTARGGPDCRLLPFERLVRMDAVDGNAAELLIDGEQSFAAIFAAIDAARSYVCVQFYTIVDDATGQALADRMIAAAGRGVTVRVMCDGVGSYGLSRRYRRSLAEAGIVFLDPNVARGPTSRRQINFRNHRKSVIVDGRLGFVGGLNVSEVYMGRGPLGPWRDTHLAIRGPIVAQLQLGFTEDWHWATGVSLADALAWDPGRDPADMTAMILPAGPGDDMDTGGLFFFAAIAGARRRIWIASAYFVPDMDTLSALKHAALRGCDVRLILPDVIDHYLPWLAAHAFFDEVRAAGVQIHRYTGGFMHQKVVLIDDDIASVGTANLDNRSFRLNFETMAVVHDPGFARSVEEMLRRDLDRCYLLGKDLDEQPLALRIGAPIARLLSPVL